MPKYTLVVDRDTSGLVSADKRRLEIAHSRHRNQFRGVTDDIRAVDPRTDWRIPFLAMFKYTVNKEKNKHQWEILILGLLANGEADCAIAKSHVLLDIPEDGLSPEHIELATSSIYRFLLDNVPFEKDVLAPASEYYKYTWRCPTKKEASADMKSAIVRKTIQLWSGRSVPTKYKRFAVPIL